MDQDYAIAPHFLKAADGLVHHVANVNQSLQTQIFQILACPAAATADAQARMIQLRREKEEAIEQEDYERASEIRDELRDIEAVGDENAGADNDESTSGSSPE